LTQTYSHNTLDHKSLIDHVVHKELVPLITEYYTRTYSGPSSNCVA